MAAVPRKHARSEECQPWNFVGGSLQTIVAKNDAERGSVLTAGQTSGEFLIAGRSTSTWGGVR